MLHRKQYRSPSKSSPVVRPSVVICNLFTCQLRLCCTKGHLTKIYLRCLLDSYDHQEVECLLRDREGRRKIFIHKNKIYNHKFETYLDYARI
jgi:hypothetical protein